MAVDGEARKEMRTNRYWFFLALLALVGLIAWNMGSFTSSGVKNISYSSFLGALKEGKVQNVLMEGQSLQGKLTDGKKYRTYYPSVDTDLVPKITKSKIPFEVKQPSRGLSTFLAVLLNWLPMILLIGFWFFLMRQMQGSGGRGGMMGFGKSRAKIAAQHLGIRFKDVAGLENVKRELVEIVDFLKFPQRYGKMGAKIPKGVLLLGAPGTGKTLLAKAVSGEAGAPFFNIAGSDFVEMFVGVGAARVRDLFEQARKNAPCIIFVDELDAVGRHRGAGLGGGNDEREQTLNQILVEMDGMDSRVGVIVLAATNRPDVLDPALMRPGRFDRQVVVPMPDLTEREAILRLHAAKVPTSSNVDLQGLARATPGFSGAELANVVNEAAIIAVRHHRRLVTTKELEEAKDKVMMGLERPSRAIDKDELKLTAYHEAGHAVATLFSSHSDPIHKATIVPRGRALGMVLRVPRKDQYTMPLDKLKANLVVGMGGRVAEELIFGEGKVTTGAAADIAMITDLARKMVMEWGFSDALGDVRYNENEGEVFLGRSVTRSQHISEKTMETIDKEVRRIVDEAKECCRKILTDHRDALERVAKALLKYETLSGDEVKAAAEGKRLRRTVMAGTRKPKMASMGSLDA